MTVPKSNRFKAFSFQHHMSFEIPELLQQDWPSEASTQNFQRDKESYGGYKTTYKKI